MIRERIEGFGSARVLEPGPGWLVAVTALPGRRAQSTARLVFAEGRGLFGTRDLRRLAELSERAPERLDEMPGDFTFAHFNATGRATLARSCGGRVPVYFWDGPKARGFSTLMGDVVRWRLEAPALDLLTNAMWLARFMGKPGGRSVIKDVSILPRGNCAVFEPAEPVRSVQYWDPRPRCPPRPQGRVSDEVAGAFRDGLLSVLDRELDPSGGNLGALSGGVDSSALVTLARESLGRSVSTFSWVPATGPARARELRYIDDVSKRSPRSLAFRFPNTYDQRIAHLRSAPPVASHLPIVPSFFHVMCRGRDFRVLFGGVGADELCGSPLFLADWLRTAPLGRLRWWGELPTGPRNIAQWAKWRLRMARGAPNAAPLPYAAALPSYVARHLQVEYRAWFDSYVACARGDDSPNRGMHLFLQRDELDATRWETASALGVRNLDPFMTRPLLEFGYALHPDDKLGPGTKRLLRRALHGDVPVRSLYRPDKGNFRNPPQPPISWHQALPPALEGLVSDGWFPYPPAKMGAWDAVGLWQLVKFEHSVRSLRAAADAAACRGSVRTEVLTAAAAHGTPESL